MTISENKPHLHCLGIARSTIMVFNHNCHPWCIFCLTVTVGLQSQWSRWLHRRQKKIFQNVLEPQCLRAVLLSFVKKLEFSLVFMGDWDQTLCCCLRIFHSGWIFYFLFLPQLFFSAWKNSESCINHCVCLDQCRTFSTSVPHVKSDKLQYFANSNNLKCKPV